METNIQEEEVLSAFRLWKVGLIDSGTFFKIMEDIKYEKEMEKIHQQKQNVVGDAMTDKQKAYIQKLMLDGRITKEFKLGNLTKLEAQIVIQQALIGKKEEALPLPVELAEMYEEGVY